MLEQVLELLVLMRLSSLQIDLNIVPEAPGILARVQHSGDMQKPSCPGSEQLRQVVTAQLLAGM